MQNLMDGKSYCNVMDKLAICADTQCIQLARPFCADPLVTFRVYPETPNQVAGSEDLSFFPFMSEHLITENFYSEPCGFSYQVPHSSYSRILQVAAFPPVAHPEGFQPMDRRYCSGMPALDKFPCFSAIPPVSHCCRSSFAAHPTWVTKPPAPQRCQWINHCLPSPGPAWRMLSVSGRSGGLEKNVPVLVRRERDGFYYRGTVKEEIENERGVFLVEFAEPFRSQGRPPVCLQKTVKDDILEYTNGMKHSLLPGDKVLAPWEADTGRYGPGTVLTGIETRDPLRASEDEEITVRFWNDKKVKLPLGVALWIPPSLCGRIVEMIHMPFSSGLRPRASPDTSCCVFSCSPKTALISVCAVHGFAKHSLLCPPCWPLFPYHCGCTSACVRCICCCRPCSDAWWPLPPRSLVFQRKPDEVEPSSKSFPHVLELEGGKQGESAAVAASCPSDSERDLESFPAKSDVVNSVVNTDSSHHQKPRLDESAGPKWKYWKRSQCKSQPSNAGGRFCGIRKTKI